MIRSIITKYRTHCNSSWEYYLKKLLLIQISKTKLDWNQLALFIPLVTQLCKCLKLYMSGGHQNLKSHCGERDRIGLMYLHQAHVRVTINLNLFVPLQYETIIINLWRRRKVYIDPFILFILPYSFDQCAQKGICKYSRDIKMPIIH